MSVNTKRGGASRVSNLSSIGNQDTIQVRELAHLAELGHYQIQCKIGEGGMGVVYKAMDPQLERLVAIKILRGEVLDNPEMLQRFRQEAEAIALLKHPFIVNIYEFRQEGDLHYFAMDYVGGHTLEDLIISGDLTLNEKLGIFTRFLRALGHAHSQKVIHRDIKPSNIIVDDDLNPHITDFGLSKRLERPSKLTREGQTLGTPIYMSPEQLSGKSSEIDQRSDLYSAGVVFYQLLTGQVPYRAKNSLELFEQINSPQPISMRGLDSKVPRQIREIAARALEKNPDQRYQDANAWADDLEPLIDSPKRRQSKRQLEFNPGVLIGLFCILATLLLMGTLVMRELLEQPPRAAAGNPAKKQKPAPVQPKPKQAADKLDALFAQAKADMNEGRFEPALLALVAAHDEAQRTRDERTLLRLSRRLRGFLTFPEPINSFGQLAPRKTKQLCDLAWSDSPDRLEKLAGQLFGSGVPMINQASTFKAGLRLIETAFYLGFEKPPVFFTLGWGYNREKKYVLALERIDKFVSFGTSQKWRGLFLRGQIYRRQGLDLSARQAHQKARVAFEKAVSDFEAAITVRGPNLSTPGAAPARKMLLECYLRLGRNRQAIALVGRYARSLNQVFNPFSLWTADVWAKWVSGRDGKLVARPAYSWRFDQRDMQVNAPIELKWICLIPRNMQQFQGNGRTHLHFSNPGKSVATLQFVHPSAGRKIMLSLEGETPTASGSKRKVKLTITVNGQTLIDRQQLYPHGESGTRRFDITRLLNKTGNNRIRIKLDKRTGLQFWLYRVQVYGE